MEICLRDIHLSFDGTKVLDGLDLTMASGDFVVVQGPSGCGKSTLLRVINRLQTPSSGEVLVDGEAAAGRAVTLWRRQVGLLQQTPVMVPGSVRDNLVLPFALDSATDLAPADKELEAGLSDLLLEDLNLSADAGKLSVGQQQRVAMLRILLAKPQMLLCDEPTSALDAESRKIVEGYLEGLAVDDGLGILLVTHLDFKPTDATVRYLSFVDGALQGGGGR